MIEGDYAGFDGTTGGIGHALLQTVLSHAFPGGGWQKYANYLINPKARAMCKPSFGLVYGNGTVSGSADTTLKNTLLSAFVVYCCLRDSDDIDASWKQLCDAWLFSGDDSAGSGYAEALIGTARELGLKLEAVIYREGPARFLGRFYPSPYTSRSCVADVPRFLRHMHIVAVPANGDMEVAMAQCALGRLVNDRCTPILTSYCQSVVKRYNPTALNPDYFDPWKYEQLTTGGVYTNDFTHDELVPIIAQDAGLSVDSILEFEIACETSPTGIYRQFAPFSYAEFTARPGTICGGLMNAPPEEPPEIQLTTDELDESRGAVKSSLDCAREAVESMGLPPSADAGAEDFPPPCAKCQGTNHTTDRCQKCNLCGANGHRAAKCTSCPHCRVAGPEGEHLSAECKIDCHSCGDKHPGLPCPEKSNRKRATANSSELRDRKMHKKKTRSRSRSPRAKPSSDKPPSESVGGGATSSH